MSCSISKDARFPSITEMKILSSAKLQLPFDDAFTLYQALPIGLTVTEEKVGLSTPETGDHSYLYSPAGDIFRSKTTGCSRHTDIVSSEAVILMIGGVGIPMLNLYSCSQPEIKELPVTVIISEPTGVNVYVWVVANICPGFASDVQTGVNIVLGGPIVISDELHKILSIGTILPWLKDPTE